MTFEFTEKGWEDFQFWIETDNSIAAKTKDLLNVIRKAPFLGVGKSDPLKYDFNGYWYRRITVEHRLVNKISGTKGKDQKCHVIQY